MSAYADYLKLKMNKNLVWFNDFAPNFDDNLSRKVLEKVIYEMP